MCHTSDICVLCMVTSVTWSWPWTELNIKHLLNQCLALYFRSTRGKFWPKTDSFEVSTARNLKAPILTFDLTLTWHVNSFGKFRGCFRIVSSRAFERRIVRLSAAIRSRVMTCPPPPPSKSRVAKYPSKCRVNPRPAGPLDFPPPAGGGGRLNAPPPWSRLLVAVEKNERQRSKAREKSFRNHFGNFFAQVKIGVSRGQNSKNFQNGFSTIKSLILKIEQRILYHCVCLSR